MRKSISLPTMGMIGAFILGIAIVMFWGLQAGVYGANAFSDFFTSFGVLLGFPAIAIVMIMLLIVSLVKLFYFAISFFLGILLGLFLLMALGSSFTGLVASFSVIRMAIRGDAKTPPYLTLKGLIC